MFIFSHWDIYLILCKKIFQLIKNKKKYISGAKVSFTSATRKTKTAI